MVYVLFKRLPNLRLATRSTLWQNPNFCSTIQVLNSSIYGGKIQIQFIHSRFHQNWIFRYKIWDYASVCFSKNQMMFAPSNIHFGNATSSSSTLAIIPWKQHWSFRWWANRCRNALLLRSFVPTHVIRGKMEWSKTASKAWNEARRVEHNSSSYPRQHH